MESIAQNTLLRDLAIVMIVAGVVTLIFHRLRQPVVLGYLLAGMIIGPYTPPFPLIGPVNSISTLAELGVVFLMFTLGMQFSLRTLRQVGTTAVVAASLEIVTMIWIGYQIGQWFGWSKMDSLFLGAMLSITSTTIIIKTLTDLGMVKERFAKLITGISLVEDMLGITLIALLSGIGMTGALEWEAVAWTAGKVTAFLSVVVVLGLLFVPPLFRFVARFQSEEMLLVTALALCFGISLLALKLGFSVALGAFLIGTIVAEVREVGKVRALMEPLRDMFIAVFFVSMGLLINPQLMVEYAVPTLVIAVAVVVGKMLSFSFGTFVAGNDLRTSLRVGTSLVPIGELSFIIASLGVSLKVTSDFLYPVAVCVSALTMLLTPYSIRGADGFVTWCERRAPAWLIKSLGLYSSWLDRLRQGRTHSQARQLARKWAIQMAINVAVVTGVFMAAAALAGPVERWWPGAPEWIGGAKGILWVGTAVLALPGLIATLRKLQAFAMLLAEMSVSSATAGKSTAALRTIITQTIFLGGAVLLGMWVLLWSATLLPGGAALVVLLCIVVMLAVVLWRFFIQVHARAQIALRETLAPPPEEPEVTPELAVQRLFRGAELASVAVGANSPAANKLIRELELRTKTGATVVAIERGEQSVINPGPDEELRPTDRVLLLGGLEQLAAARKLFNDGTNQ